MVVKYSKSDYRAYLRSPTWKKRRLQVFARANYRCEECGTPMKIVNRLLGTVNLQVHHKTYRNVFHEPLDDLICLCDECHKSKH